MTMISVVVLMRDRLLRSRPAVYQYPAASQRPRQTAPILSSARPSAL